MKIKLLFIILISVSAISCKNKLLIKAGITKAPINEALIDTSGTTLQTRIKCPEGYSRTVAEPNSFTTFLRNLKLKPHGTDVQLYNGKAKQVMVHCGVIDMPIRNKDLQQCADSGIRLYAEYLYATKQYDKIRFNFTNGQSCAYVKYAEGFRMRFEGEKAVWYPSKLKDYGYDTFLDYLDLVYMYAGSFSLSEELIKRPIQEIAPGDLFIYPGFPGHVVIVLDVCQNDTTGEKLFLTAQGFTPAQEIEVLVNLEAKHQNPWYTIPEANVITPQFDFTVDQLYRWK
ncbi:MAG: DUF4846 domain-containing protein [Chitinophagaceae bacterium]|jgi:hypothetical protein